MHMHQDQAGTRDASGWITAKSTYGGFTVKVPIPYNDFTIDGDDPSSLTRKAEVVGCKSREGIKFSATKAFYKAPGAAAKQFEKLRAAGGQPGEIFKTIKVDGHEAIESSRGNSTACAMSRAILVGEEMYLLVVEWPIGQEKVAKSLVPTFFESFKVFEQRDKADGEQPTKGR